MSWDVFIQHLPASAMSVDDVPDDFVPLPLGSRAYVVRVIQHLFPGTDASDPTLLKAASESEQWSMEFAIAAEDPVHSLTLRVRGNESVIPQIETLIDAFGARAVDSWTGEFFERETAVESLRRWQTYVDETT